MAINDDKYSIRLENSVLPKVSLGPRYGYILAAVAVILIIVGFNFFDNESNSNHTETETSTEQSETNPNHTETETSIEQSETNPNHTETETSTEQSGTNPNHTETGTSVREKITLSILEVITFDFGESKISSNQAEILLKYIQKINCRKGKFNLEGHADSIGSDDYNMNLSLQRALSVKRYLEKQDCIADQRMELKAFGETKPVASNTNAIGRRKNRRVVIQFTPSSE